ncbi:MAG: hypothetical protein ACPF93_08100 [Poseidonia sp.]
MVTVACPHCEGSVDLPDGATDVFTCLHCGGQFGYLPDEGEGMEAEVVPLAPDPNKDEPDAYERNILFGFKLVGAIGIGLLTAFLLFLGFIIMIGTGIQQSLA